MLPNEILPAIPRQKVIVTHKDGKKSKYDFIGFVGYAEKPHAVYIRNYGGFIHEHPIENCEFCEPVPEEPRPLRIGDKVCATSEHGSEHFGVITSINATRKWYSVSDFWFEKVRRVTSSEVAQYFN